MAHGLTSRDRHEKSRPRAAFSCKREAYLEAEAALEGALGAAVEVHVADGPSGSCWLDA